MRDGPRTWRRSISTTLPLASKAGGKDEKDWLRKAAADSDGRAKGKRSRSARQVDPKTANLEEGFLATIRMPPPLWMTRSRYLRHWTIHRAWLLFRRKQRETRAGILMRQYQSMQNACEALRNTAGPGQRDTGYLYRVAMEKKGVYRHQGIPIEYARPQTDTPAREAWDHGWKR